MERWRRPGAKELLLVVMLFATIGYITGGLSDSARPQMELESFLTTAFLVWRVSRGGWLSRMILIIVSGAGFAVSVLAVARMWDPAVITAVITCAVQVALLVSPPVYGRTRRTPVTVRLRGWSQLVRRPPVWLLGWGLLAGVLLTLACLGSMDFIPVPGCRPATSDACIALAEGYPLRWLTARQNEPMIFKGALLKDCAQWALASTSVLYLAWLSLTTRTGVSD